MAEKTLGTVRESEKDAMQDKSLKRIWEHINEFKGKATQKSISNYCRYVRPNAEDRKRDISELLERGWIEKVGTTYKSVKHEHLPKYYKT